MQGSAMMDTYHTNTVRAFVALYKTYYAHAWNTVTALTSDGHPGVSALPEAPAPRGQAVVTCGVHRCRGRLLQHGGNHKIIFTGY